MMIDSADPERVRLTALVDNLNQAVLMETPERTVARTNQAFCDMFGIPAPPQALTGGDCVAAARSLEPLLGDVEPFLARVDDLIADWRTVTAERIVLTDGRLLERDFLPVTHPDGTREIAWVYRDVTEWERLRATAEESARQNAELLSAISHDVRTPVTGIVGLVELLQRQQIDTRTRQIVDSVRQSAASLTTMLDDFLDAARADAGLLQVEPAATRPDRLLDSVCHMVGPLARAKGLLLLSGVDPAVPTWLDLDAGRVRQILVNLVSNAVKFTPTGVVTLTATVADAELVIVCRDTGPGLGDQEPAEIFRAFVRDSEERTRAKGAGLGLAIASKLAAVMGGSLHVAHTGPDGSAFELRLPLVVPERGQPVEGPLQGRRVTVFGGALAAAAVSLMLRRAGAEVVTAPDRPVDAAVVIVGDLPVPEAGDAERTVGLVPMEPFRIPPGQPGVLSTPVGEAELCAAVLGVPVAGEVRLDLPPLPPGLRVLLVEDDSTNRVLIARMLEVLGVECTAVADGVAALQQIGDGAFDAVLMDIHLPGLDGVETTGLVRRRRGEDESDRMPVVAMTGSSGWTDPQMVLTSGFDATLTKPMTIPDLHACLTAVAGVADPGGRSPSLDRDVLAALAEDIGDDDLVRETVRTYLEELPVRLTALTRSYDAGDQHGVTETAHSLKSASAMLGAVHMSDLCAVVEQSAKAEECRAPQVAAVRDEAAAVAAAMTRYLD